MDNCIICLESNDDSFSRITTQSSEWSEENIQRIIEKHFWWWFMKPSSNDCVRWICRRCWHEISSFHNFYLKVESGHKQLLASLTPTSKYVEELSHRTVKHELDVESNKMEPRDDLLPFKDRRKRKLRNIENDKNIENVANAEIEIDVDVKSEFDFNIDEADEGKLEHVSIDSICFDTLNIQEIGNDWKQLVTEDEVVKENIKKIKRSSRISKIKSGFKESVHKKSKQKQDSSSYSQIDDDFFKDNQHKLECCICNIPLTDFRMLKVHYRNEHNTLGYAMCCGKKYFKRCLIIDHLKVHKDPDFFKCQICVKSFGTRRGLEMHMESHKSRERKYNCDECGKSYFKLHIFERHKLTHVPESERNFNCSQCDKKFASDYIRRQHEDSTHAKKYAKICDICGRKFCHSYSFLRHMEEHAGAPPPLETCDICGVKLTNKYGLKQHMKNKHVLQEQTCPYCSRVSLNLNAHRMHIKYMHTMQRKHACHLCEKAFKRPLELKEHLSTHTGEALYTCPHCPRTFISNANMHKHRKIAHRQEWEEARLKKFNESHT